MNIEDLVDVPEQEYTLHLTDHNADGVSYGADMARDADYRYQTEKDSVPKSQFFGKIKSPIKEATYFTGFLRTMGRFAVEAPTNTALGLGRAVQESILQPALNIYDRSWYDSLDWELEEYKKSVGFDNMTQEERHKFNTTDPKFLDIRRQMTERSREIAMRLDPKFEEKTNELYQGYKKQIAQFEESIGIGAKETDSEIVNMIGSGAASLLEAGAIVAITKNPAAAAYVFGVQQGSGLYEEARQEGIDVAPALGLATAGGIVEGLLEEWGLHKIADNIVTNTIWKAIGKSVLTESIQEGSQQFAEEALMYKIRDDETWKDKAIRIVQSAALGGLLGPLGTIAARPFVLQHANSVRNELVQNGVDEDRASELVNQAINGTEKQKETASHDIQVALSSAQFQQAGLSPEESQSLAENLAVPMEDMKTEIIDSLSAELDPITYEGGTIESGARFFDDNIDKSLLAEDFDIAEQVKAEAVEGGMNEEQANLVATAVDSFAKVMYNKTGITPRENWENGTLHTMIKDERPRIEDMQDVEQTEEEKTKWDDGSYVGEDGMIHDKDGKVLFQKGAPQTEESKARNDMVQYQDEASPRGLYKHSMNNKILEILKNGDASTVIHELGHYFTINYLEALQNAGQEEEARAVLDWLGVNSISDLMADTQQATDALEKLARAFETYVMTEEAPSSRLKEFFDRFKNWLIDIYNSLAPEQINEGVRDFFDGMIATQEEDFTDVMRLAGQKQDVREVIKQALAGKAVEVNGVKIDDIKSLVKALNARIPKKVRTLVDYLKDVGINEDFARQFDLQHTLGVSDLIGDKETLKQLKDKKLVTQKQINEARKLITKEGGISSEDELINFLHELGLMPETSESYEDTSALWEQAMDILANAENTYAQQDVAMAEKRQEVLNAIASAEEMLSGIDYKGMLNALKTLAKEDTVGVNKETLKYIKDKQKAIDSGYKKLLKQMLKAQKKDMQAIRDAVVDYIKDQPILAEDKAKLLNFIKKANSLNTLQKVAEQIKDKAMEYYDKEQRKELGRAIQKELKHTKPYSGGEQRYDYENNKLFKTLRDYNKLTKAAAGEELAKLPMEEAAIEDLTETDLIKRRFLSYKAGGADASAELLNQVLNDIVTAKEKGKLSKSEEEHEQMVNMENDRQELIKVLDESKANPKDVGHIIQNKYRTWITSLYSMLNSIFGKNIADKYQLETKQTDVEARVWQKTTDAINNVAKILGVKGRSGVLDAFSQMAQNKQTITDSEGVTTEIDTFGIIDMYNAIKNDKTKQDYYAAFGEGQVNSLINTLTVQERALGDYLMQEVNGYYKKLNDVYVKLYGIDLPKVDNYWMATSEHKDSIDIQGDYFNQTTIPSALKERSKGRVIPIPKNAWQKFNKHIAEAEYISGLGLDYMNIKKIFKSRRIKSKISEKYGDAVYRAIMDDIESLSMAKKIQEIDEVNNTFQKILGNTVLAKIAIGIPVFVKQLASVTNYAVDMPTGLWAKDFAAGLSHPKETVKYMMENAPFLKARLGKGYNEALERVIRDANKMSGKKVKWAEAMSSFTRYGDIGAIIFGGYPYMKYLQNTGVENAAEKFEFSTLRSQQSGTPVSLSPFQRSRGMMQIFQAFNNTPTQYMRMIFDSIYQYKNGDITAQQMAKSLFNFGIIQPILYVLAGEYAGKLLFWGDDDKEEESILPKILRQILINPIDGIPVFSDFIGAMFDRAAGDKNFGMKPVLISDIDKAFSKLNKKELDSWDIAEILTPFVEAMTGAPMGRFERMFKKNFKD